MKKFSRREFIEAGMVASIATRVRGDSRTRPRIDEDVPADESSVSRVFEGHERSLLAIVADEIIPAGGGMPAASQVGCVDYLERIASRSPKLAKELKRILRLTDRLSQTRFQATFGDMVHDQRLKLLHEMEWRTVDLFKALRDSVYEAYYEQPEVWRLIGYQFYATDGIGPTPAPFDPQILTEVFKRPFHYRAI
jgi:hypothetical protein